MQKNVQKYYTVWAGLTPGVYNSWDDCKHQVQGVPNARYKSFPTLDQAKEAFEGLYENYKGKSVKKKVSRTSRDENVGKPILKSICVDAACSGVGGPMEYRGVDTETQAQLFHIGPLPGGTNNLGEFLALVHGLAFLKNTNNLEPIYTDSKTAMAWVKNKKCNSKHPQSTKNEKIFELVARAEKWLRENQWETKILKWETAFWGEIPADFGRK